MNTCDELLAALRLRNADILALTAELVAVESGSYDAANVARVGELWGARWKSLGFEILGTLPEGFLHPSKGYVGLHIMHRKL